MSSCCHISFHGICLIYIDNGAKEECFSMLTTEISWDNVVKVGEVSFAVLESSAGVWEWTGVIAACKKVVETYSTAKDLLSIKIGIVA